MKTLFKQVVSITGLTLLCSSAYALCIDTGVAALGKNDVGLAAPTCVQTTPNAASCDMNGLQGRLPTHGQVTLVFTQDGAIAEWVLGWTRNGPDFTEEYYCRLAPSNLAGPGWAHRLSGQGGPGAIPKQRFALECKVTATC